MWLWIESPTRHLCSSWKVTVIRIHMIGVICREAHGSLVHCLAVWLPKLVTFSYCGYWVCMLCVYVSMGLCMPQHVWKPEAGFWESLSVSTVRSRGQSQIMRLSAAEPSLAPKLVSFKAYEKEAIKSTSFRFQYKSLSITLWTFTFHFFYPEP